MTLFSHLAKKNFKCKVKLLNNKLHDRDVCLVGATALSRKPEIFFFVPLSCSCSVITKLRHKLVEQSQNMPSPKSAEFQITLRPYDDIAKTENK